MKDRKRCWICHSKARDEGVVSPATPFVYVCNCPRCGRFSYTDTPRSLTFEDAYLDEADVRAALSHAVRLTTLRQDHAQVTDRLIQSVEENSSLPGHRVQAENLLAYLGSKSHYPGDRLALPLISWASVIGAAKERGAAYIISSLERHGLVEPTKGGGPKNLPRTLILSFDGWNRYEELSEGRGSHRAFMAMQFGDPTLDGVYHNCFKPAVALTGFDLERVDLDSPAGLIDDRIFVGISTSRFAIADLTHNNRGAYWEAGVAEGQGKPVIYTCEKSVWEDPEAGTHFDTNHRNTVIWSADNLKDAAGRLKALIRRTLPGEADMEDPRPSPTD